MKRIVESYSDFVKNLKQINEGGGAGIQFTTENLTYQLDYTITKDGSVDGIVEQLPNSNISFHAEGYDDGGRAKDIDFEVKSVLSDKIDISFIDKIKVKDMIYNNGTENFFTSDDDGTNPNYNEMTLREWMNVTDNDIEVSVYLDYKYDPMHFGGWVRGTFNVGDVVFNKDNYENTANDGQTIKFNECNFSQTEDFKSNNAYGSKYKVLSGMEDITIYDNYVPSYLVTEEFVDWYKDVFENDDEEYEDED